MTPKKRAEKSGEAETDGGDGAVSTDRDDGPSTDDGAWPPDDTTDGDAGGEWP